MRLVLFHAHTLPDPSSLKPSEEVEGPLAPLCPSRRPPPPNRPTQLAPDPPRITAVLLPRARATPLRCDVQHRHFHAPRKARRSPVKPQLIFPLGRHTFHTFRAFRTRSAPINSARLGAPQPRLEQRLTPRIARAVRLVSSWKEESGGLLLPGAPRTAGIPFCCPVGSDRAFVLVTYDREAVSYAAIARA